MGILAFDFAGEEEVKKRGGPNGVEGKGSFPSAGEDTFLHDIISTDRLTSLPIQLLQEKTPEWKIELCPTFATAFVPKL